jgi:hypothetical protein
MVEDAAREGPVSGRNHQGVPVHLHREDAPATPRHPRHLGHDILGTIDVKQYPVADGGVESGEPEGQLPPVGDAAIDEMAETRVVRGGTGDIEKTRRRVDGEDAAPGSYPPGEIDGDDATAGADIHDDLAGARREELKPLPAHADLGGGVAEAGKLGGCFRHPFRAGNRRPGVAGLDC